MASRLTIYQQIADILSFEVNANALQQKLTETKVDWDAIVVEGSRHLVLPALYCRLKAKNSLHLLPEELQTYLEELTTINRNRNQSILEQVRDISDLFTEHNIDHVFLKGAAMLASGYFKDIAERMVGDIDILIAESQIDDGFELLKENKYKITSEPTFSRKYFAYRHMPRLVNSSHICAVEIHQKLFSIYCPPFLEPEVVLANASKIGYTRIPSIRHLFYHNILSHQINDKGALKQNLNFRNTYDTIVHFQNNHQYLITKEFYELNILNYLNTLKLFFDELNDIEPIFYDLRLNLFIYRLKFRILNLVWNSYISFVSSITWVWQRIILFIRDSNYRKDLWNDRRRIVQKLR